MAPMPRIVDADARRAALVAVAADEIVRVGLGSVTLREIARRSETTS